MDHLGLIWVSLKIGDAKKYGCLNQNMMKMIA